MKSAQALAEELSRSSGKPTAYTADGNTVGMWSTATQRYEGIYSATLLQTWTGFHNTLINGKEPVRQWIPVEFATLTLDLDPDVLTHTHDGPPDDSMPTCPVCHYPDWQEDEAYEAQRLIDLDPDILDILDGVSE